MYIDDAQGIREPESSRFLLLALSHTEINFHEISSSKEAENLKGTLCVESIIASAGFGPTPLALEPQDSDEQDISLILRVDDVEIVLPRTPLIRYDKASGVLVFTDLVHAYRSGGDVQLIDVSIKLDESYMGTDQGVGEAETLEVVLAQYGVLQDYDTKPGSNAVGAVADNLPSSSTFSLDGHGAPVEDLPEDFRGKVVLLDQDNGEVLGTLGDNYRFREDANLNATGNEKGPVMIDLPNEEREGENPEAVVHTVPIDSDERDYLLQSARVISSGIVLATSAINTSMSFLSSFYQSHSTPNEKPAVISNRTKSGVKAVHGASGQALRVTHKAVGFIDKGIEKAVEYFDDRSRKGKGKARSNEGSRVASPVLLSPMSSSSTSMSKSAPPTRVASPSPLASPIPLASESGKDGPAPPPYSEYAGVPPPLPSRKISGLEPPPLPKRSISPSPTTSNKSSPPISRPSSSQPQHSQQQQQRQSSKKNLLSSLLLSADLLSTTLESSAKSIITTGTDSLSSALKHKYGQETGDATRLLGESVRNVVFVYIDAQGIGRKALLMKAGAGVVRARVGGREVLLTADDQGMVKADEKSGFNGASDDNANGKS